MNAIYFEGRQWSNVHLPWKSRNLGVFHAQPSEWAVHPTVPRSSKYSEGSWKTWDKTMMTNHESLAAIVYLKLCFFQTYMLIHDAYSLHFRVLPVASSVSRKP